MPPSEFRVEKSDNGYRVALYRGGKFYVSFMDGLTLAAAEREARSLTVFWQRIQARPVSLEVPTFKRAS